MYNIQNPFLICSLLFYKTTGVVYIPKLPIVRGQFGFVSSYSISGLQQVRMDKNKKDQLQKLRQS
jgi:hypothetical protein